MKGWRPRTNVQGSPERPAKVFVKLCMILGVSLVLLENPNKAILSRVYPHTPSLFLYHGPCITA